MVSFSSSQAPRELKGQVGPLILTWKGLKKEKDKLAVVEHCQRLHFESSLTSNSSKMPPVASSVTALSILVFGTVYAADW